MITTSMRYIGYTDNYPGYHVKFPTWITHQLARSKYFGEARYQTLPRALTAAKSYRNKILKNLPKKISKKIRQSFYHGRVYGVGIARYKKWRDDGSLYYIWRAQVWDRDNRIGLSKTWSENQYTREEGYRLAVAWRERLIRHKAQF